MTRRRPYVPKMENMLIFLQIRVPIRILEIADSVTVSRPYEPLRTLDRLRLGAAPPRRRPARSFRTGPAGGGVPLYRRRQRLGER